MLILFRATSLLLDGSSDSESQDEVVSESGIRVTLLFLWQEARSGAASSARLGEARSVALGSLWSFPVCSRATKAPSVKET